MSEMTDRSCAEILAVLLKHGQWFHSAIELDAYDMDVDAVDLEAEARRAVSREGACLGPCHQEHGPPFGLTAPEPE